MSRTQGVGFGAAIPAWREKPLRRPSRCARSSGFGLKCILVALMVACNSEPGYGDRNNDELIAALRNGTTGEKVRAANALGSILRVQPNYPKVVKALAFAVQDTSDVVRLAAASALSADGVDKFAALSGLHEMFHDTAHPDVRASVAQLIAKLGPERARPLLPSIRQALDDSNPKVRVAALESIAIMGSANSGDAQLVARLVEDSVPAVRRATFRALAALRPPASLLLPVTSKGLEDRAPDVRSSAAFAICSLGQEALPALDNLIVHLDDPDPKTVQSVVIAIASIGPQAGRALIALDPLKNADSTPLRAAVAMAISSIAGKAGRGDSIGQSTTGSLCAEGRDP